MILIYILNLSISLCKTVDKNETDISDSELKKINNSEQKDIDKSSEDGNAQNVDMNEDLANQKLIAPVLVLAKDEPHDARALGYFERTKLMFKTISGYYMMVEINEEDDKDKSKKKEVLILSEDAPKNAKSLGYFERCKIGGKILAGKYLMVDESTNNKKSETIGHEKTNINKIKDNLNENENNADENNQVSQNEKKDTSSMKDGETNYEEDGEKNLNKKSDDFNARDSKNNEDKENLSRNTFPNKDNFIKNEKDSNKNKEGVDLNKTSNNSPKHNSKIKEDPFIKHEKPKNVIPLQATDDNLSKNNEISLEIEAEEANFYDENSKFKQENIIDDKNLILMPIAPNESSSKVDDKSRMEKNQFKTNNENEDETKSSKIESSENEINTPETTQKKINTDDKTQTENKSNKPGSWVPKLSESDI